MITKTDRQETLIMGRVLCTAINEQQMMQNRRNYDYFLDEFDIFLFFYCRNIIKQKLCVYGKLCAVLLVISCIGYASAL